MKIFLHSSGAVNAWIDCFSWVSVIIWDEHNIKKCYIHQWIQFKAIIRKGKIITGIFYDSPDEDYLLPKKRKAFKYLRNKKM